MRQFKAHLLIFVLGLFFLVYEDDLYMDKDEEVLHPSHILVFL